MAQADEGRATPWVHPLIMDKNNTGQGLRSVSDSVEAICPCADVRGINISGQKRDELLRINIGLAKTLYSESETRGAGEMLLNSALRNWCRTSLYPSRSINKSKITVAWPGI